MHSTAIVTYAGMLPSMIDISVFTHHSVDFRPADYSRCPAAELRWIFIACDLHLGLVVLLQQPRVTNTASRTHQST